MQCLLRNATLVASIMLAHLSMAQPNVVLFIVDDMGPVDWQFDPTFNTNGSNVYETPNMLRLAQRGVTFSNGYAAAPVCSPSRASIMTGKSAANIGITDFIGAGSSASGSLVASSQSWLQNMPASEVLLPEAMLAAGYRTGFFGKWHLGQPGNPAANPLASGFEVNIAGTNSGNPSFAGGFFAGGDGAWSGMPGLGTPGVYPPDTYLSDAISERAAQYIADRAAADEKFLAVVSHYVVHTPIEAPPSLVNYYTTKLAGLTPAQIDGHTDATYAAMVQKMDEALGRLLDTLEDPNGDGLGDDSILDDTIIIFTADNGGLTNFAITSNRPFRDGKGSMYEGGIREPLIIQYSGQQNIAEGVVTGGNAIGYDIYPTILDLTGVEGDPTQNLEMDGISLRSALEDPVGGAAPLNNRDLYWHYPHRSPQAITPNRPVAGGEWVSAVRRGSQKLMYFYDQRSFERYDLATDDSEQNDLFADDPMLSEPLARSLHGHLRRVDAPMPRDLGSNAELPSSALLGSAFVQAGDAQFTDTFDQPNNYITDGTISTGWEQAQNTSLASVFDADLSQAGSLTLRNAGLTRIVAGDLAAPMLTRTVTGDFMATMQVGAMDDVNFHVLAMLVADPADPESEFLWVGQQNRSGANDFAQARNIENGTRTLDIGENGMFSFYRIERTGNVFIGFLSADGELWVPFVEFNRPDMPDTIELSLTQALFGSDPATGTIEGFQVVDRCAADIADPIGTIDVRDVVAFLEQRPASFISVIDFLREFDDCR